MKVRHLKKGQLLKVRGSAGCGLTQSGRIMIVPFDQEINFLAPNKFYNIRLEHIVGPLKGVQLHFAIARCRKVKIKPVCFCSAYPHPHNKGLGKCQNKQENQEETNGQS